MTDRSLVFSLIEDDPTGEVGDVYEVGSFPDPEAYYDGGLEWHLRYAPQANNAPMQAARVVGSFTYLLSANITTTEAIWRLRKLRRAYQARAREASTRPPPYPPPLT